MKFLKNYLYFINEGFDLGYFYKKEHMPELIQKEADIQISDWHHRIHNFPADVNIDKLKLWFARNIKTECIKTFQEMYDKYFKDQKTYSKESITDTENILNYFKGKESLTKDNEEMVKFKVDSIIGDFNTSRYKDMIVDYIFSNVRNTNIWKINYIGSFKDMYNLSVDWHNKLKASGSVTQEHGRKLIEYPDGFYWIDLQTNDCNDEADAMGHCGRTSADTLLSLRQLKKDGTIEPYVTIAIDYDDENIPTFGKIYQNKGKNNKKPVEKYHKYIVDLYLKYDIGENVGNEYMERMDFSISDIKDENLLIKILNENPRLIIIDNVIFYENENLAKLLINKYPELTQKNSNYPNKLVPQGTISNNYYLYEKGLMSREDLVSKYPNTLIVKDDKLYLKFEGDLKDLDFMYSDKSSNHYSSSRDIVKSMEDYPYYHDMKFKDLYLGYLTDKAEQAIIDKINKLKINMDKEDLEEFNEYNTWEKQIENIYSLEDIKNAIVDAYGDAQNTADSNEKYESILTPLLNFFNMDKLLYDGEYILIKINRDWLIRYDKSYGGYSNNNLTLTDNILKYYFEEFENQDGENEIAEDLLEIDIPYYGWDGKIDKDELEERIIERLSEIKTNENYRIQLFEETEKFYGKSKRI